MEPQMGIMTIEMPKVSLKTQDLPEKDTPIVVLSSPIMAVAAI
jgi:hypothetical protein